LLLEQLREYGIVISAGQLHRILTEHQEPFHQEKAAVLAAIPGERRAAWKRCVLDNGFRKQSVTARWLHCFGRRDWHEPDDCDAAAPPPSPL